MVKITTHIATDFSAFNLSDVLAKAATRGFINDMSGMLSGKISGILGGVTYDAGYFYETALSFSGSHALLLFGSGFTANSNGLTGGTVKAFFDVDTATNSPAFNHLFQGLSLSAVALQAAMGTASLADDVAVLAAELTGNDTFVLSESYDTARGYAGNDRMFGNGGNDSLSGGFGDDTLNGGLGHDTLVGGKGNDVYRADQDDTLVEQDSGGTDEVRTYDAHSLHTNFENLTLLGDGDVGGIGTAENNVIKGNAGANLLFGLAGNDTISGGAGADMLAGGKGDDVYYADALDTIQETTGEGRDLVYTRGDFTLGNSVNDITLLGSGGFYKITGNEGGNRMTANASDNRISGMAGNDVILAGAGHDILNGGLGQDTLNGGVDAVRDVFVFIDILESKAGALHDVIVNFKHGTDLIDLSQIDAYHNANPEARALQNLVYNGTSAADGAVWYRSVSGGVVVRADVTGDAVADMEIMLTGVQSLSAGDFYLIL